VMSLGFQIVLALGALLVEPHLRHRPALMAPLLPPPEYDHAPAMLIECASVRDLQRTCNAAVPAP
jgi:hypothetical protein